MSMKSNTSDPYLQAMEHVRKMPDGSRGPFLRGVIDGIKEHGGNLSLEELRSVDIDQQKEKKERKF